jgi:two-component system osmolarity sensor histidine kinase EnvZ
MAAATPRPPLPLARQHARWLLVGFLAVELLVAGLVTGWVLLPLAQRSADDLARLMVLSAQTWAELPPATRPAFEVELLRSHGLALRADLPAQARDEVNPPYFYLLESALTRRLQQPMNLMQERVQDQAWYWAPIPTGPSGRLALLVGVSETRIQSQPLVALGVALAGAVLAAVVLAHLLARQLTRPLARLEAATATVGQGGVPLALPETGSRELVALSRRFNAMATQVQDLLRARTTLLAGVSHDLRTPLARLRLALELLKDQPSPALLARMEGDLEQMNQLIGDVLSLARGLAQEPTQALDMPQFLEQLALESQGLVAQISIDCAAGQVHAAPTALRRALGNLLQNALRYGCPEPAAGQSPAPIELRGEVSPQGWRLSVLDHGPGIPPEQLQAVFEPFVRLETSRSPASGGSGLGLSIVRELARAHGWQVGLANRPQGGLQAWVFVPTPGSPLAPPAVQPA